MRAMKTQTISSWKSWKEEIGRLREKNSIGNNEEEYVSPLLFRGHKCASWRLESTFERRGADFPSIEEYGDTLKETKNAFESYTGYKWDTVFMHRESPSPPEDFEFMVYLRHHGFPTPILDWTRSPYVASFFAFQEHGPEKEISIYSFREYLGAGKGGFTGESRIVGCGPNIKTHRRHYVQQSEYTFCRKKVNDKWYYSSHEDALAFANGKQDVATKYVLPACIRNEALADLDSMNINAYSLFGSEEGLAEMIANRTYGYDS